MGDIKYGSRIVDKGIFQYFLGRNVQVIGRLIQDQKVGLGKASALQRDTRPRSPPLKSRISLKIISGKQKGGKHISNLGIIHVRISVLNLLNNVLSI